MKGIWRMVNSVCSVRCSMCGGLVYGVWCMVYGAWCMVYGVWCMGCIVNSVLCIVLMLCGTVWYGVG